MNPITAISIFSYVLLFGLAIWMVENLSQEREIMTRSILTRG